MSNNKIKLITTAMFGSGSNVGGAGQHNRRPTGRTGLYLDSNGLESISINAFSDVNVNKVHLSNNELSSYPRALNDVNPDEM